MERRHCSAEPVPAWLQDAEELRSPVLRCIAAAKLAFDGTQPGHAGELKITVLTQWSQGQPSIFAHVAPLPPRPQQPVKIQVHAQKPALPVSLLTDACIKRT